MQLQGSHSYYLSKKRNPDKDNSLKSKQMQGVRNTNHYKSNSVGSTPKLSPLKPMIIGLTMTPEKLIQGRIKKKAREQMRRKPPLVPKSSQTEHHSTVLPSINMKTNASTNADLAILDTEERKTSFITIGNPRPSETHSRTSSNASPILREEFKLERQHCRS